MCWSSPIAPVLRISTRVVLRSTHVVVIKLRSAGNMLLNFLLNDAEMPFSSPTSMPTLTSFVTSVSYQWTGYGNGNTSRVVQICYSAKYSATIGRCHNISDRQQATIHNFDGLDASGKFWIRHQIWGGTYPAISSALDTVTVMHQ